MKAGKCTDDGASVKNALFRSLVVNFVSVL